MKRLFEAGVPGADPTLPDAAISINGNEYQLAYDFPSIVEVEKMTGINLLSSAVDNPTFSGTVALLFAAMKKAHPDVELKDVQEMVDLRNVFTVLAAVRYAWGASVPDPEQDDDSGEEETQEDGPEA